jgi:hypothetical protein
MAKDSDKSATAPTPQRAPVDLRGRVPQMSDDELATLRVNAARLKDAGTALQRNAVADLLPVVEAEIARRRAEKLASAPPKASRGKKKVPAAPALDSDAADK